MRLRLQKYLPVFLIALSVQILAPIALCWAAAAALADPLGTVEICHDSALAANQPADQGGQTSRHDGGCSICCLAGATASIAAPEPVALAAPYRMSVDLGWHDQTPDLSAFRVGSNARARAPPASFPDEI
jgi:hypothetical protein